LRPPYYRGCWHGVSRRFLWRYRHPKGITSPGPSSPLTAVYTPKSFLPHAASLRQPFGHCAIFPTAASRRSLGRISVPMWGAILSDPLGVIGLVSRYLTNYLIPREPLPARCPKAPFLPKPSAPGVHAVLARVSPGYPPHKGRSLTCYAPVRHSTTPEGMAPFDLHVLSAPPAFVLSQDQTLQKENSIVLQRTSYACSEFTLLPLFEPARRDASRPIRDAPQTSLLPIPQPELSTPLHLPCRPHGPASNDTPAVRPASSAKTNQTALQLTPQ